MKRYAIIPINKAINIDDDTLFDMIQSNVALTFRNAKVTIDADTRKGDVIETDEIHYLDKVFLLKVSVETEE